jgi:two-component system, OmpR family, response regulator
LPYLLHRAEASIASAMSRFTPWGGYLSPAMGHSTSLQNGLRVLVVDSDLDSCELLVILLAEYGIETTIATCVSDAIAQIHQAPPDLLISEIWLPGEDGYSLMRQVKTLETALRVEIPAIALTTMFTGERDCIYSLTAGFCRYLLKPFDLDELLAVVASLTRFKQSQQMFALKKN